MDRSPTRTFLFLLVITCLLVPFNSSAEKPVEQSVIAPLANRSLLLDVELVAGRLIAVGERGHILVSSDSGNSWEQVPTPTRATLTGLFFLDDQHGWAVGHDQVILKTEDGGQSWRQVYQDIEADSPLFDIFFMDTRNGYAIGAYGQFLESSDGGLTWSGRWISEDDFHLNQIIPFGKDLFIAAEAGFVYRSEDRGATWTPLTPDYEGSFFGIMPDRHDNSLLLFGLRGNLFRSTDAGDNWMRIETSTEASLTNGLVLNDGRILITGLAGALLISNDNGHSFRYIQDSKRRGFSRLRQTTDGHIIAVGDFGAKVIQPTTLQKSQGGKS